MGRKANLKKQRKLQNKYQDVIRYYREFPDTWIENILGVKLSLWQKLYLRMVDKVDKLKRSYK